MSQRAPRRVRVGTCDFCTARFRFQRMDETRTQICPVCFLVHDGEKLHSTLERPQDVPLPHNELERLIK